jgi:methylglutaconyl-CoA hydratase
MPSAIGPYIVKKVGEGAARVLFLTGDRIDAERAREIGYVSEVTSPETLDAAVERVVETLLHGGPQAQKAAKELLESLGELSLEEAKSHTAELIARMRVGEEAQEGMAAFLDKRKPRWSR